MTLFDLPTQERYAWRQEVLNWDEDGVIETPALGPLYLREYPFAWDEELGWLFVVPGPLVQLNYEEQEGQFSLYLGEAARISGSYGMSWYLWTDRWGWLQKSALSDLFLRASTGEWLTQEQLLAIE